MTGISSGTSPSPSGPHRSCVDRGARSGWRVSTRSTTTSAPPWRGRSAAVTADRAYAWQPCCGGTGSCAAASPRGDAGLSNSSKQLPVRLSAIGLTPGGRAAFSPSSKGSTRPRQTRSSAPMSCTANQVTRWASAKRSTAAGSSRGTGVTSTSRSLHGRGSSNPAVGAATTVVWPWRSTTSDLSLASRVVTSSRRSCSNRAVPATKNWATSKA